MKNRETFHQIRQWIDWATDFAYTCQLICFALSVTSLFRVLLRGYSLAWEVELAAVGGITSVTAITLCWAQKAVRCLSPSPLDEAIVADHGDNLATVMRNISVEPLEYCALFSMDGLKISEGTLLSPETCRLTDDGLSMIQSEMIFLHNHPGPEQTSFSPRDLGFMADYGIKTIIVVTRDFVHTMTNPYWEDNKCESDSGMERFAETLMSFTEKHQFIFSINCLMRQYVHYVLSMTARHYGLQYSVRNFYMLKLRIFLCKVFLHQDETESILNLLLDTASETTDCIAQPKA